MSTYSRLTKNPKTDKFEMAVWHDDYFAPRHYGVRFPNGDIVDPELVELETKESVSAKNAHTQTVDEICELLRVALNLEDEEIEIAKNIVREELNKPEQLDWKKEFKDEFGHHGEIWNGKKSLPEGMNIIDFISKVEHQAILNERTNALYVANMFSINKKVGSAPSLVIPESQYKKYLSIKLIKELL